MAELFLTLLFLFVVLCIGFPLAGLFLFWLTGGFRDR